MKYARTDNRRTARVGRVVAAADGIMTDKRGFWGGVCLVIGGLPLVLYYGAHPFGYAGVALALAGLAISYGARRM